MTEAMNHIQDWYNDPRCIHANEVEPEVERVTILAMSKTIAELGHEENDSTCNMHILGREIIGI